jgi:hypothetical protein
MQTQKERITMHYFEDLAGALGDRSQVDVDGTKVNLYKGRARSIVISEKDREIDLSETADGKMMDGIETRQVYAPHDDERDTVPAIRPFPQNEKDIQFMTDLAAAIRESRNEVLDTQA